MQHERRVFNESLAPRVPGHPNVVEPRASVQSTVYVHVCMCFRWRGGRGDAVRAMRKLSVCTEAERGCSCSRIALLARFPANLLNKKDKEEANARTHRTLRHKMSRLLGVLKSSPQAKCAAVAVPVCMLYTYVCCVDVDVVRVRSMHAAERAWVVFLFPLSQTRTNTYS